METLGYPEVRITEDEAEKLVEQLNSGKDLDHVYIITRDGRDVAVLMPIGLYEYHNIVIETASKVTEKVTETLPGDSDPERPLDFLLSDAEFDELINLIDCVLHEGDYPLTHEPLSHRELMNLHSIMAKLHATFVKEE